MDTNIPEFKAWIDKILKGVFVSLLFLSVSQHAFAYTSSIVDNGTNLVVSVDNFDYSGYPCVEGFPPFNVPVVGYQIKLFKNNGTPIDPASPDLVSPVYTGNSVSTFTSPTDFDVLAVLMSCVPQNSGDQYYSEILASGFNFDPFNGFTYSTLYTILASGAAPTFYDSATSGGGGGGSTYTPPHFDLIGGNDLLAAVGGGITTGVQETGKSMWPMFVFLGVVIAFIIALQVAVFSKRAVGGSPVGGKNKSRQIADEYGPDHPDYKAYKRGREIIEKEHPGFYDE